jgi:hypothetical protein
MLKLVLASGWADAHRIYRYVCSAKLQGTGNTGRMASENGAPGETRTHAPGFGGRCSIQLSYGGTE